MHWLKGTSIIQIQHNALDWMALCLGCPRAHMLAPSHVSEFVVNSITTQNVQFHFNLFLINAYQKVRMINPLQKTIRKDCERFRIVESSSQRGGIRVNGASG